MKPTSYLGAVAAIRERGVEWDFDPTLDRIHDLMDLLGHPQRACPVIHVTGTNGKSSTVRLIDTLLRERGLRVGRFTSPHLSEMRERIAIDGEPVSEERFAEIYDDIVPYLGLIDARHKLRLSFFEVLTAMAYAAFADTPVDVAVVEVGMGGTWDATNVADAAVAVITPIGLDHTDYLGETIEKIAAEKAGIIKPGSIAILAHQQPAAAQVLLTRVAETGAAVAREGAEFGVIQRGLAVGGQLLRIQGLHGLYDDVFLPLFGEHQASNAAVALAAVEAFASGAPTAIGEVDLMDVTRGSLNTGDFHGGPGQLAPDLVRAGFAQASSPGRLEVVRTGPAVLVDSAHNPAGMAATAQAITEAFGFTRLIGVLAVAGDKDVAGVLDELEPLLDEVVVTRNSSPRSLPSQELAELAASIFDPDRVHVTERLDEAIDQAMALADATGEPEDVGILITGSVITAGDARTLLRVRS